MLRLAPADMADAADPLRDLHLRHGAREQEPSAMKKAPPAKLSEQILAAHLALRDQPRLTECISYVQRKLECSYNRAALLVSFLEDAKVISVTQEGGHRHWLILDCDAAISVLREAL